ncbi:MAG: hypothetical protein ED555_13480 [Allomuricauda sp.]|nr:MAG: hypothetical protein ED555_13480 [Allomuricauda sp.]
MTFREFLNECRDKDVFKNLSIYVVSSWVLLQVVSLLAEPLNLPRTSLTILLLILLLAFPLYAFFLWQYRIKPENALVRSEFKAQIENGTASSKSGIDVEKAEKLAKIEEGHKKFQKKYFASVLVLGLLSVSASAFIVRTNFLKPKAVLAMPQLSAERVSDKIAVLTFDNNTGNPDNDIIGKMVVDWIMHGITQNGVGQVISPKIIEDYSKVLKASVVSLGEGEVVQKYFNPSKVIDGSFYKRDGKLLFQSSITDGEMAKTLVSLGPIECDSESPLDCVEELKQRILGFLATEDRPLENWQETPPNYEAYKYLLEADNRYGDNEAYFELISKALAVDSTFFEAKVRLLEYYFNYGDKKVADSIVDVLGKKVNNNRRQWNLLKMYEALLDGDNGNTYKYLRNEYDIYPFDISTNTSLITVALECVNKPEDIAEIFNDIDIFNELKSKQKDFEDCLQCEYRLRQKGWAEIELGNYQNTIDLLQPFEDTRGNHELKKVLIRAYVRKGGNEESVREIVSNFELEDPEVFHEMNLFAAKEYTYVHNDSLAQPYYENIVNALDDTTISANNEPLLVLGYAHLYGGDYKNASKYLGLYLEKNPQTPQGELLARLAIAYHKSGNTARATTLLGELEKRRIPYRYGRIDYAFAEYYGAIGDEEKMMGYLKRAVADGKWFKPDSFHNDVFLLPYVSTPEFKEILTYWH